MVTESSRPAGRRVLFVAHGFPPYDGSGVWTPLATANALARRGHQVTVLAADHWTLGLMNQFDPGLVARIDPAIEVKRLTLPLGPIDPMVTHWSDRRAERVSAFYNEPVWRVNLELDAAWRALFPEPKGATNYARAYPVLNSAARALHRDQPFDLVFANASPWTDFSVALRLGVEGDVPTVIYDRDSWLFNVFTGQPYGNADKIEPLLDQLLGQVTQAWFINDAIAALHREHFPRHAGKIKAVRGGWDPEFLPGAMQPPARSADRDLVFRFIGTITSLFPLEMVQQAWRLAGQMSEAIGRARLEFVGDSHHPDSATTSSDGIVFRDKVSKESLPSLYQQTDVLLFLKEGGGLVTSGKVYEYVATGLPIVAALQPAHDARQVLAGRDLVFLADAVTPEALARAFALAASHTPQPDEVAMAHQHALAYRRDVALDRALSGLEGELGWT
ncbi:MAG: glycosyltransferase [Micrococcales bacterium]|nr:glycosyltransferase [Micrococcales bacterium]